MGKIIERYQLLIGLLGGFLILSLIFSTTVYFLGVKDKLAPPSYAATSFPSSKAVVAAYPVLGGFWLVKADGSLEKKSHGQIYSGAGSAFTDYFAANQYAQTEARKATVAGVYQSGNYIRYITGNGGASGNVQAIDPPSLTVRNNTPSCGIASDAGGNVAVIYFDGQLYKWGYIGCPSGTTTSATWNP